MHGRFTGRKTTVKTLPAGAGAPADDRKRRMGLVAYRRRRPYPWKPAA